MSGSERLRSVLASMLVVLAGISLLLASTGWWLERYFLDTKRFTATVDQVLDRQEVKAALSHEIVREIRRQSGQDLEIIEPFVASIVSQVVDSSAFRRIFNAAVSTAHRALVDREVPQIVLNLEDAYDDVRRAIRVVSPRTARDLPESVDVRVELLDRTQLGTVWDTIDLVEDVILVLTVIVAVLLAAGLALSPRRWRTLALAGWVGLGAFAVFLVANAVAKRLLLDRIGDPALRDATGATWDVVTHGLVVQTVVILVLTGLVGLSASWIGRIGGLTAARDATVRGWQRLRAAIPAPAPARPAPGAGTASSPAHPAAPTPAATGRSAPEAVGAAAAAVMARLRLPEPAENRRVRHAWRAAGLLTLAVTAFLWPHALTILVVVAAGLLALYLAVVEGLAALRAEPVTTQGPPASASAPSS